MDPSHLQAGKVELAAVLVVGATKSLYFKLSVLF